MPSATGTPRVWAVILLGAVSFASKCENIDVTSNEDSFPIETHSLLPPEYPDDVETRISVGSVVQPVDPQPIEFKHDVHASSVEDGGLGMSCEYCHSNARKSKHAGVPPTQTCVGCHSMIDPSGREGLVQLDTYIKESGENYGQPIPWVKVHDIPDFVYFNHSRHVKSGVECTDCHADMSKHGVAVRAPDMTMLMGWCLECHAEHPSVDANYGADADLRRAELKDCYTCHQ